MNIENEEIKKIIPLKNALNSLKQKILDSTSKILILEFLDKIKNSFPDIPDPGLNIEKRKLNISQELAYDLFIGIIYLLSTLKGRFTEIEYQFLKEDLKIWFN